VGLEPSDPRYSYKGDIAAVRIYNRKLTTDEIAANFAAGVGTVLWYIGDVTESSGSTVVTEGGATDSFDVVLTEAPAADVTISISPLKYSESDPNQITLNKTSLVFTSANWDTSQTVMVSAVDDGTSEGTTFVNVYLETSSADPDFDGQLIPAVSVEVIDND
jgi:hypothetical protein